MTQTINDPTTDQLVDGDRAGGAPPANDSPPDAPSNTNFESLAIAGFIFGIFAMVVAVFAVGLAARAVSEAGSGGGASSGAPTTLDVTLSDFKIDPDEATIAQGGTINLVNEGNVQHDLVVDTEKSDMLDPGATGAMVLGSVPAGDYTVYCSVPGHREAGMVGNLTVE